MKPQRPKKHNKHNKHEKPTKIFNKFEGYYLDDISCQYCLQFKGRKRGCALSKCACKDEKSDAVKNGRIQRKRGSLSWDS
jgi:hypothetical protein